MATQACQGEYGSYQVVVLHVNTSDGKIGKQAKIHFESCNFQEAQMFQEPPPTPAFLWYTSISINTT